MPDAATHRGALERTPGDDVVVQLRVLRVNLPSLEAGVVLGHDLLTHAPIVQQLVKRDDGIYDLLVITNPIAMSSTPDPVDPEEVSPGG